MTLKTVNGYDYYEVMSAFQKSIRRCDEDQTVFWGIELYESNMIGHLWNRIFIVIHEDIGLAEPNFTTRIWHLKQAHDYLAEKRPKKWSKKLVMLQIFIELARAKKSRYVDLAAVVYWANHQNRLRPIPDYAFDMHTIKGKKLGRGLDHFYTEGAKINNNGNVDGEEQMFLMARNIDGKKLPTIPTETQETHSDNEDNEEPKNQLDIFDDLF
jgi:replication-associated recombination protein RarA